MKARIDANKLERPGNSIEEFEKTWQTLLEAVIVTKAAVVAGSTTTRNEDNRILDRTMKIGKEPLKNIKTAEFLECLNPSNFGTLIEKEKKKTCSVFGPIMNNIREFVSQPENQS